MADDIRDRRGIERFARALETGERRAIADLLGNIISERDQIDAKLQAPEDSKLAKHILAIANSGGGAVLFGVDDGPPLRPSGMPEEEFRKLDNTELHRRVQSYVPSTLAFEYMPYDFTGSGFEKIGDYFGVTFVDPEERNLPYISLRDGSGITQGEIYVRRNGESVKANPEELRRLIDGRLAAERRALLATGRLSVLLDALDEVAKKSITVAGRRPMLTALAAMTQPHAYRIEEEYLQFLRRSMAEVQQKIANYLRQL